jgi:farnesyl-diphosphate farnesyltransferase
LWRLRRRVNRCAVDLAPRTEVTIAYLLFRVADTIEDATLWSRERKLREMDRFESLLAQPSPEQAQALAREWSSDPPLRHEGYERLLRSTPEVLRSGTSLAPEAWTIVSHHTRRTARGMATFVARERDGRLELADLRDLQEYCYAVAGIVGEMLTELFLRTDGRPLAEAAPALRRDAAAFGEALQLVNILKDSATDSREGRHFLPPSLDRAAVFDLAWRDLGTAARYCARLERAKAGRGLVSFTALPILLAQATLGRVAARGPGAKITRAEVSTLMEILQRALPLGEVESLLGEMEQHARRGEAKNGIEPLSH